MKEIILSISILLSTFSSLANESAALIDQEQLIGTKKLEAELIDDLNHRLKLNSLILEVASEIDDENPNFSPWRDGEKLEKIMRDKSEKFSDFYLKRMDSLGPQQKSLFQKAWKNIQWNNLVDVFKRSSLGIQTMFKRKGFGIVVAIFMGFVSDYTIPIILSNIGAAWLIPISLVMPYQVLYAMLPQKVNQLQLRFKVRNSLGSQTAYRAYLAQEKSTRAALKNIPNESILIPIQTLNSGHVLSVSVGQSTWFKSFVQRMGFYENALSLTTLKRFLSANSVEDNYIKEMLAHPRLKSWQKAALITTHLQESMNEEMLIKFRTQFDKNFVLMKSLSPWSGFEDWSKELLTATSIARINELLLEIPHGTPNRLVLKVWDEIVLPHYATKSNLNYFKYRRLLENFETTKAAILTSGTEAWNLATHQKLIRYIGRSLGDKAFVNCQNSGQKVLHFLLN